MRSGTIMALVGTLVAAMPEVGPNGHPVNPNVKLCAQTKWSEASMGALLAAGFVGGTGSRFCPKNVWGLPCRVATYVVPSAAWATLKWSTATSSNSCYDVMKHGEYPEPAVYCPCCRQRHRPTVPGW